MSLVSTLHRGLRPALRQSLEELSDSLFSLPYDEYIEYVQRLDRRSRRPYQPPQKPASSRQPEPMDVDTIRVAAARITRPESPVLSEISSTERRSYRLANDLCLCCGASDHWISECPQSRQTSLSRQSSPSRQSSLATPLSFTSPVLDTSSSPKKPRTKVTAKRGGLGGG